MHPGPITYRRGCCCPSLLTLHQDAPAPAQDAQIALITGAPQPYKSNRGRSQCGGIPRGVWGVSIYHLGCPPCGLELTSTTRLTIGISSTTWLMNVPHITMNYVLQINFHSQPKTQIDMHSQSVCYESTFIANQRHKST